MSDNHDEDARLFSPSAARNRDVICEVVAPYLSDCEAILEIASGTGEHALRMASAIRGDWLPSDPDPKARASIDAHRYASSLENIAAAQDIDVTRSGWATDIGRRIDAIVSINMVHIAPFAATEGLFAGAENLLNPGQRLFLYGPFKRDGFHTAPSNEAFDASLMARDPRWGVRDLEREIKPVADKCAFSVEEVVGMPANNVTVIFVKSEYN